MDFRDGQFGFAERLVCCERLKSESLKRTLSGRLLADTDSLPKDKLKAIKAQCYYHARLFEYAFLLDVIKDEQAQGITIDSARCFFKSKKREYILIMRPGISSS